ncbi:MAG TPA: AAA family ATPase [Polyangiaceae bacterium]|nr:AAA family ATPase [Polyangiaceae bacterium]
MQDRLLVGRDRELRVLEDAVAAASRGERAVLMITGEPGIGKTRLMQELVGRVIAAGGVASWGRTWELGQTPPFFPWYEVLAALETPGDPAPSLGSVEERGDGRARFERFGQVVAFLRRRAAHAPVALLFDDLHAADPSSLQLLEYALPLLVGRHVLFALAARDRDANREVESALGRLQRGALRVPLSRLAEEEVRALVGGVADAQRVYELSDGNPLFVEELLAAQRTRGSLGLPALSSVRAVIRERVARLPEPSQKTLLAAATLGRDFRGRIVGEMTGETDVRGRLDPAISTGLLAPAGRDRYRFSHALVAEAIAEDAPPASRTERHLAAARALERWAPEDVSAIAHHLLHAGDLVAESAGAAATRAAERCMAQLAFEDAAALYERAVETLPGEAGLRRAELLCARAEALQHATQHAAAASLCDQAANLVRALPGSATDGGALFARVALARGLEFRFGRTDPVLVGLLREALERLGDDRTALRAKLLARLAAAEQPALDPQAPVERAREAVELARGLDPRDRLQVTYVATAAFVDYVAPGELEPVLNEVLHLAAGVDRWIAVHTRLRLCFTALLRIDRRAFEACAQTFTAEAEALGLPQWTRYAFLLKALGALLDGRFEEAEAAANRFESTSLDIGDSGAVFIVDVHRAMAAWSRTAPLDPSVRARLERYVPGRAAIAAWFSCQDGALDAARAALAELAGRIPADPDLAAMVAAAAAMAGERALAEDVYRSLLPRGGSVTVTSMVGSAVMDLSDRLLLLLAVATERWDAVEGHAASALGVAARLGSPVWTARVEADYADALERRARPGDLERAAELRSRARRAAEHLGMPGVLSRCRAAGAGPTAAATEAGREARPSSDARVTCSREGALWIVSGLGERVHVKTSRGMEMVARLVAEPGAPLHALDLAGATEGVDGGDSGPALDARARAAYRARLGDLVSERDDAERCADRGRYDRLTAEIEALGAELERAFGLGGRERRVGAASERARTNAQRRIAHALDQIRAASPRLGEHLVASIRTGTYCVYEPR